MAAGRAITILVVIAMIATTPIGLISITSYSTQDSALGSPMTSLGNGIELRASINATTITPGQKLNISIDLFNTFSQMNRPALTDDWEINGFPIAIWPPCTHSLPIEFAVLKGNYSLDALEAMDNSSSRTGPIQYDCLESFSVRTIAFQMDSDRVNLTETYKVGEDILNQYTIPYRLNTNFTVNGYWGYPLNILNSSDLLTSVQSGFTFQYPEVGPVGSSTFIPGVYTVAIADEWGQTVILHLAVLS